QAHRQRFVAGQLAVGAGGDLRLGHPVLDRHDLDRFAVVVPSFEGTRVRLEHVDLLGELVADPLERGVHRPLEHPVHQSEREEGLASVRGARREVTFLDGFAMQLVDRHLDDAVPAERVVLERVDRVLRLVQVVDAEGIAVDDQDAAVFQVLQIGLERGRVHDDQAVEPVAGGVDVGRGEVDLKTRNPRQGAGGGANLSWEVRERRDVVPQDGRDVRELRAGELHAVTGIAREPDGYGFNFLNFPPRGRGRGRSRRHSSYLFSGRLWGAGRVGLQGILRHAPSGESGCWPGGGWLYTAAG